ncbi:MULTISPECIES: YbjN domain-containing protein [Dermabacter]|uniref:YbjN domain-containing protein n=1 Tax=Dermabacter vaginalis TaxID=1630135 RepID=A0ABX6A2N0_9MICO|nr:MULTISPECIES: YbjN domain-containing protein [Dermabacter]QEU11428.1 YbjN domain-containing protein [Dermabacter vaginalis]RUP85621.1 YbjN domain-containing protein [Dermabacter sp. HSID17554]
MPNGHSHDAAPAGNKLTIERLEESLERLGYAFVEDDDTPNVLRARFDHYPFTFAVAGEHSHILVVRGRWDELLSVQQKLEATRLCNHWNMERMWPKVYVRRENDSALGMYGELVFDYYYGVSDEAIDRAITCALSTTVAFFSSLSSQVSDQDEADA